MAKTAIEKIKDNLDKPLPKKAIKQREGGGGRMLDYLEGWWVKQNANKIFGIGNWSYKANWDKMEHIALPKTAKNKTTGLYTVPVTLKVQVDTQEVVRSDIGVTQYFGEAGKEMAIKGCVTDALKRGFASFGEQFGLTLYDKGDVIQPRTASGTTTSRGWPTQEELMAKYSMDIKQVAPKCPSCSSVMKIIERKDKSGIFWSCPNWRTKSCKSCNIDDVEIDGTITSKKKSAPAKPEPQPTATVEQDDIPF